MTTNSKKHHWWPQSLCKKWLSYNGTIYQNCCSEEDDDLKTNCIPQTNSRSFGFVKNSHSIKISRKHTSPWDENFEKVFDEVDNRLPKLINLLEEYTDLFKTPNEIVRLNLFKNEYKLLIDAIISLLIRSPRTTEVIEQQYPNDYFQKPANYSYAINPIEKRRLYQELKQKKLERGDCCLLINKDYFCFGDGFYNTYRPLSTFGPTKILLPILPHIAILYYKPPSKIISSNFQIYQLETSEAKNINAITTESSINNTFSIGIDEKLYPSGKFKSLTEESHQWCDELCRKIFFQ
jgi:hypothetical protein